MVAILWSLDLQLSVQSVPITTKVVSFEPCSWGGVLVTTLCDKVCQWLATGRWISPGTPVSSTNKTYLHDITEILLKVALNTNQSICHLCVLKSSHPKKIPVFPIMLSTLTF